MIVYTETGKALILSAQLVGKGGEGAVYDISGYKYCVAKIYHDKAEAQKREKKICAMAQISRSASFAATGLADNTAWPLAPLYDAPPNARNKKFIGFGMNKIPIKTELNDLYVYPPDKNVNVSIAERVDCLISLCDVEEKIHSLGQVIGDQNPNNIKVGSDYRARLVDVDSFHVKVGGKEYCCTVCGSGYMAPELVRACHGTTFEKCTKTTFTKYTDNFGLAVHVFRMLMNGCHPYAIRKLPTAGSTPVPKPLDKRVEAGETPFFRKMSNFSTPVYAPDLNALPPYITDLFKRAFVEGNSNPKRRPNAAEWKKALIRFKGELTVCGAHKHYKWKGSKTCPYCDADRRYLGKVAPQASANRISSPKNAPHAYSSNPVNNNIGNTVAATVRGNVAAAAPVKNKTPANFWFWFVTVILSAAALGALATYVLPPLYDSIAGDYLVTQIGVIGGCIAGLVGMYLYNSRWASGKKLGRYEWYEYALSVLTCVGFTFAFGAAMGLVYVAFFVLIIAFIILIISGG